MAVAEQTIRDVATATGATTRQVSYAALVAGVKPVRWIGPCRVFDAAGISAIKAAMKEIATNPGPHRRAVGTPSKATAGGKRSA